MAVKLAVLYKLPCLSSLIQQSWCAVLVPTLRVLRYVLASFCYHALLNLHCKLQLGVALGLTGSRSTYWVLSVCVCVCVCVCVSACKINKVILVNLKTEILAGHLCFVCGRGSFVKAKIFLLLLKTEFLSSCLLTGVPQTWHRLSRVQVPLLLLCGRILLFWYDSLLHTMSR